MENVLDKAEIIINLSLKEKLLAKVTIRVNNEFEIRFCRITRRENGTLWFQPPALQHFGFAVCFGVLEKEDWYRLERRVINKFFEVVQTSRTFDQDFIDELQKSWKKDMSSREEIGLDKIPL